MVVQAPIDPIYSIWHRVRAPFRIPKACHDCRAVDWEVFDIDKAGCVHCGQFHQCIDGGDCIGIMEGDHQACEITGCWIRNRNFQQGYTEGSIQPSTGCAYTQSNTAIKPWVESTLVMRWIHTLIRSDTARRCISREIKRVEDKATVAFAKVAKGFKLEGKKPCMIEMLSNTRFVLGNLRIPCKIQNQDTFDELARECTEIIMRFTSSFRQALTPHVPSAKLDHFVIGLIYLLRTGIVMFDTMQVVPRIPILRRLLPMETSLKMHFKIPCKIITEVENITKITLKALDRRKIKTLMES